MLAKKSPLSQVHSPCHILCADLAFLPIVKKNGNISHITILVLIDAFSRFLRVGDLFFRQQLTNNKSFFADF